jgi:alpha-mannosidase
MQTKITLFTLSLLFTISALAGEEQKPLKVSNETFEILKSVTQSALADGDIMLSVTTHQDLGWVDEVEKCVVMRDTQWITPFMDRLSREAGFEMDIEQASIVQEYIKRHPEKKAEISKRLKEGRMLVGATYTQPYEEMFFAESLARQFYLGKLWLKNEFDGYNATSYYNSDVPGRSLQMPQLMAKAEVNNMFISRHGRGVFDWYSPDGSKVTAYSPGHYIDFYWILGKENEEAIKALAEQALIWCDGYNDVDGEATVMPAVLNFEFIWDQKPVKNMDPFMKVWNNLSVVENQDGEKLEVKLPKIKFSTLDKFFKQIKKSSKELPSITGERPNVWVYIHGPSHHWAVTHSREADILLPAAEKFAMADVLVSGSFSKYPVEQFNAAWESKIYPDHGWGGKGGQSTDDLFLLRFADAHAKAERLLDNSIKSLASKVNTSSKKGIPIVVFNSLSWERTDPVTFSLNFDSGSAKSVKLFTKKGVEVPVQLENTKIDGDGFLNSSDITFIASNVPSVGFDTYYVKLLKDEKVEPNSRFNPVVENKFFKAVLSDGGISSLIDKELNRELIDSDFFKAGEVFTMKSKGNGAGDFRDIQKTEMEGFDKTGNYKSDWKVVADGPVLSAYKFRQPINNAVAELVVTFYHGLKKIDFDVAVKNFDGTMYREYRMALPLNINNGQTTYEVAYGVVNVGEDEMEGNAGYAYITPCKEVHPRGIENWISTSGDDFGVTLSSSVVGMDFIDPTDKNLKGTILQPILLASRKSIHKEGNDYHQTGNHEFSFSITSHKAGWKNGMRFGRGSNENIFAVVAPEKYASAKLKESQSFLSVDNSNIVVTAIKKAENEDAMVIRFYNIDKKESEANFLFWKPFEKAFATNLIEEEKKQLKIDKNTMRLKVGHHAVETVKLK